MARSRIIAGKAVIIIEAQDLVNKTLGKVRGNLHKFANEVGNIGETLFRTGFFGSIASGAVVNSFVKFDDAMRTLRVNLDLFGKTAQQVDAVLKPLEARIRTLAQSTPFNPTQVAQAATELAKGGFNPKQIEDSLQAVLDLARATNTELGFSAEFVVRTLTTYGIATDRAAEVVSQLVRASRKGTLGIEDLEAAMRFSSGTADTLGVSLQKMLAIFTVLSNRGLVGSLAGTSTNTAFSQLVKKAQELKDLGKIELVTGLREDGREALDVVRSLEEVFKFAEKLPFTEQQTLFQDVFNLRGARSVSAIRRELDTIKKLTGFIADANDEAREAARIQDAGIGGSLRRLLSTIQDLNIALGQSTEKIIIKIAATIKGLLEELNKLATLNPALTSLIILSPGILLAAGVGLLALSKALRIAAYGATILRSALQPIGNLLAKGTAGQISALSALTRSKVSKSSSKVPRLKIPVPIVSPLTPVGPDKAAQRLLVAQNQRNAAIAVQRTAKAEVLLAKAQRARASSNAKLVTSIRQINNAQATQKAIRDQNTRSLSANLLAAKKNADAVRLEAAFQQSITRLKQEDFDIQRRISSAGTQVFRPKTGGLAERPNLTTRELNQLTKDRERIAHQIFRIGEEQKKLGALPPSKFELRQKALLAERARITQRTVTLEKTAKSLSSGKAVVESRYVKQLTKGQDLLLDSAKARRAIQTIDLPRRVPIGTSINRGIQTAVRLGTSGTRGLLTFGKGMLTVLNVTRRFVFSFSGVLTILEGLLLFGDKIPGVATVLERFSKAFSNAFRAIGNIATYAAGPIELLKASIEAFTAGRSDIGITALINSFKLLGSIIANQLLLAWNRFKEALGSVYGIMRQLATGIYQIFSSVVTAIGSIIGTLVSSISTQLGATLSILGLGGSGGLGFEDGASGISSFIKGLTLLLSNLPILLASIIEQLGYTFDTFTLRFEQMLRRSIPFAPKETNKFLDPFAVQQLSSKDQQLLEQQLARTETDPSIRAKKDAGKFELAFQEALDRGFISSKFANFADKYIVETEAKIRRRTLVSGQAQANLERARQANIEQANKQQKNIQLPNLQAHIAQLVQISRNLAQQGIIGAAAVRAELDKVIATAIAPSAGFDQSITSTNPLNNPSVKLTKQIADALVGSAQQTSRNLLRTGKTIEQKQLEEQQKTNELLEKGLRNEGVLLAP